MKKLNLGSGSYVTPGYINIDIEQFPGVDLVHDLNTGIPAEDGTVSEIIASHVLEHLTDPLFILREMHRVCTADAVIEIRVPLYQVWQPDHLHCFYPDWFERNAPAFNIERKIVEESLDYYKNPYELLTVWIGKKTETEAPL